MKVPALKKDKKLAARISAKKGQILPSHRRFFRLMRCIELKKAACLKSYGMHTSFDDYQKEVCIP